MSKQMTGGIGVTGLQRLVVRVVGLFPGRSAGDVATVLHVHPSTLTVCFSDWSRSDSWLVPTIPPIDDVRYCVSRNAVPE